MSFNSRRRNQIYPSSNSKNSTLLALKKRTMISPFLSPRKLCDMLVPCRLLNGMHQRTSQWKKRAERKQQRLAAEEEQVVISRAFRAYGRPLGMVTYFWYLGRGILAADDYWPEVIRILARERDVWKRMMRILRREGAEPRVTGFSLNPWFRRYCSSVRRHWWSTPEWAGSWRGSRIRWRGVWRGGSCSGKQMGSWSKPRRRQQGRRLVSRRWRSTSGEGRTQSRSTLLRNYFWNCVMVCRGHQGHGWVCNDGSRRKST